jgi:hypothetical protein
VRDVGFLVWVVLLFVGVVGSIVSSIRKKTQQAPGRRGVVPRRVASIPPPVGPSIAPGSFAQVPAPLRTRAAPSKPLPPPKAGVPPAAEAFSHGGARPPKRFFSTGKDLARAVIAAEVLGKPRGLADEYPFR